MEKNFTLMKTLSAFCNLLFLRSRKKKIYAVNNDGMSLRGCCTVTTVNQKSNHTNDAKQHDASFSFYDQSTINDKISTGSSSSTTKDQKLKSNEDPEPGVNDELASGNGATPIYKNWRDRVNDDLAACTAVEDPFLPPLKNSSKRRNENINVDHIFTTYDTTTINTYTTTTNRNDALLPFASFSFLFIEGLANMNLCQIIYQLFFGAAELFKNRKPVLLTIPIRSKETRKPNYNDGIKL